MDEKQESVGIDEWRSFARPFFDVLPSEGLDEFRARVRSAPCGRLILSEVAFSGSVFDRDPATIGQFESSYLLLERYSKGACVGRAGDIDTRIEGATIHFVDMSRPYRSRTTDAACQSVVIPHDVIDYIPGQHERHVSLFRDSPRGKLLDAALTALFEAQEHGDTEDAKALSDAFTSLVRRFMLGVSVGDAVDTLSRGATLLARRHVTQRLHDLDLHPDRLCAELGVSRASLYRIFAPHGGVMRYLTDLRLDRCFIELRAGPRRRGRVREVAERWGFFESANFNRRFRDRFGMAPSECMDAPFACAANGVAVHPVQEWLRRPPGA